MEPFGWLLTLDLHSCDAEVLNSPELLEAFVDDLIRELEMVKFGEFECHHFGHTSPKTAGYSFKQWIETSSIIGHAVPFNGSMCLDIFSCKFSQDGTANPYVEKSIETAKRHFKTDKWEARITLRGVVNDNSSEEI